MSDTEKTLTPGCKFYDLKYSPCKLIEVIDHPALKHAAGDEVVIPGSNGKLYGPYRLDREFSRGAGNVVWVAFSNGATAATRKEPTKAELQQENAALMARLAKLEASAATPKQASK